MMDLFGMYKSDDQMINEIVSSIDGLQYFPKFLSEQEELDLVKAIDLNDWLKDLKRKVQHYGFKYDYRARRIDESYRIGDLPIWSDFLIQRMIDTGLIDFRPDQLIINNYEVGEGISMHVDCEPCFTDTIISLSLCSDVVMDFKKLEFLERKSVLLQRGSLLLISGDARYNYEHGIAQRKSDTFNGQKRNRKRRISLTFRKVIIEKN